MSAIFSFTHIHIEKLTPVVKGSLNLSLDAEEVLLLGSNGSGKSSFLRLIESLRTFDFTDFFHKLGIIQKPYEIKIKYIANFLDFRFEVSIYENYYAKNKILNETLEQFVNEQIANMKNEEAFSYKLDKNIEIKIFNKNIHRFTINLDTKNCFIYENQNLVAEMPVTEAPAVDSVRKVPAILFWTKLNVKQKIDDLDQAYLGLVDLSVSSRSIFQEGDEYYDELFRTAAISYYTSKSKNQSYEGVAGGGAFFRIIPFYHSISGESNNWIVNKIHTTLSEDKEVLSIDRSDLKIIDRICEDFKIKNLKFNFFQENKEKTKTNLQVKWKLKQINVVVNDDEEYDSSRLSYGQKRYLSLLLYISESTAEPLLIDEPTNGLHHTFVDNFYYAINKTQQLFMTTQSPWLLDFVSINEIDDAKKKFILCIKDKHDFVWRNLSREESKAICDAKDLGIQSVDQVLRSRGIW